jgi:hypothetical protein
MIALGDDGSKRTHGIRISRNGLVRHEVEIALDAASQFVGHSFQFAKTDLAEFRAAVSEIAKAEGSIAVNRMDLCQQPPAVPVWYEEFDDAFRIEIESGASRFAGSESVCEEFGVLSFSDECHWSVLCWIILTATSALRAGVGGRETAVFRLVQCRLGMLRTFAGQCERRIFLQMPTGNTDNSRPRRRGS